MRALVLSAGGSFGAYQAGVWRALEQSGWEPEVVVGTSAGSLNATAIARGCTAAQLEQWWRDPAADVFAWNWPPRGLSLYNNRFLQARIEQLFDRLSRPSGPKLAVTVTTLPDLSIHAFAGGRVTPRVLLASCAVPGAFPPVEIEDRWYCDGGIFCRLPLAVAVQLGATEIIAVDLLKLPTSRPIRGLLNALHLQDRHPLSAAPPQVALRVIAPHPPLGRLRDTLRWNQTDVQSWIERGFRDAMASAAHASIPMAESAAPR